MLRGTMLVKCWLYTFQGEVTKKRWSAMALSPYTVPGLMAVNKSKYRDKIIASVLAVGRILKLSRYKVILFCSPFSHYPGGTGWKALPTNFDQCLVCVVCGMCLTAAGTVWIGINNISLSCQLISLVCHICSPL